MTRRWPAGRGRPEMSESADQAASVTAQTLSGAGFLDRVVGHANGVQSWRWTWRMGLRPDVSCFSTPRSGRVVASHAPLASNAF